MANIKQLQPHQARVVDELNDLKDKRTKLTLFIRENPTFPLLSDIEQARLRKQSAIMADYEAVLEERIANF